MQLNVRGPALALAMLSFFTACAPPGRAVFDARAVPLPPSYSPAFKRALAVELDAAPDPALTVQVLADASQYYDRIRRLKMKGGSPK